MTSIGSETRVAARASIIRKSALRAPLFCRRRNLIDRDSALYRVCMSELIEEPPMPSLYERVRYKLGPVGRTGYGWYWTWFHCREKFYDWRARRG